MAKYKNERLAIEGDTAVGVDAAGNAVSGTVVMIHRVADTAKFNLAVSQNGKLVGDLHSKDFLHKEDAAD